MEVKCRYSADIMHVRRKKQDRLIDCMKRKEGKVKNRKKTGLREGG
jgi:hypothetical protein